MYKRVGVVFVSRNDICPWWFYLVSRNDICPWWCHVDVILSSPLCAIIFVYIIVQKEKDFTNVVITCV